MSPRNHSALALVPTPAPRSAQVRFPSVAEIERVLALPDLVLRNLLVTQRYHELSAAVALWLGPAANWCTFATWASKQAGQTIRQEDLQQVVERELSTSPEIARALAEVAEAALRFGARLAPLAIRAAGELALVDAAVLPRAGAAVSRGNTKVFAEIAAEFSRFLAAFGEDDALDGEKIARFTDRLRPGFPPEGQGYLRRAFLHLYQARFAADAKARAELIHLANVEIGFHEQTRLQPEIEDALNAALPDPEALRRRLLRALFPAPGPLLRLRLSLPRWLRRMSPLDRALDHLIGDFRALLRRAITGALMRLELPGGALLHLASDIPRRFPAALASLTHPELAELLAGIDPTPDSLRATGARDWAEFGERMHYIADLFRCQAEERALFEPPFKPGQVAALEAGWKPSGRL